MSWGRDVAEGKRLNRQIKLLIWANLRPVNGKSGYISTLALIVVNAASDVD